MVRLAILEHGKKPTFLQEQFTQFVILVKQPHSGFMDIVSDRPPNKSHQANTQKPRLVSAVRSDRDIQLPRRE